MAHWSIIKRLFYLSFTYAAPPNITFHSVSKWEDGEEYTEASCFVDSVAPAASVTWHVGKNNVSSSSLGSVLVTEDVGGGLVVVRSSVHLLSSLYSGQNLTCTVQHPGLRAAERRTTQVPEQSGSNFLFFSHLLSQVQKPEKKT